MARWSSFSFPNRSCRWAAPLVMASALLAACGSHHSPPPTTVAPTTTAAPTTTSTSTTTSTTVAPTTTAAAAAKTCVPAQLAVFASETEGTAGSLGRVYQLQNSSSAPCTLLGYPGLVLLGGSSAPLPTTVVRQPGLAEVTVNLAPGGSAFFSASWPDGTGYAGASCPTSTSLEITPPNDTMQLLVTGAGGVINAFGGTLAHLQCGTITVTPVRDSANT